jgi:hypothetical protein
VVASAIGFQIDEIEMEFLQENSAWEFSHILGQKPTQLEGPLLAASSTDRCNTFCELLSRRLIEQGLSRPFIELPCDGTELGLAVQGQIGTTRKILAQQSVGVFV